MFFPDVFKKINPANFVAPKVFYLTVTIAVIILYTIMMNNFCVPSSEQTFKYVIFEKIEANTKIENWEERTEKPNCYHFPGNSNEAILVDILNAKIQPNSGKAIFFLMTTCSQNGIVSLKNG